jgi:hypothetical protein
METIISYITEEFIKKLIRLKEDLYKDPQRLAEFIRSTHDVTDDLARRIVQEIIQELDEMIYELPVRKKIWIVERRRDCKKYTTSVGDIVIQKTLYESKTELNEEGKPLKCYLLDKLLGLAPNQTMTEDAMANVYHEAVQTSYRKGGEMASPNGISKGAVKDLLHKTKFPANFQIPQQKKVVDYLYIDADEDHYHLQFKEKKGDLEISENGRKLNGAINKIIYVFEDIVPEAPKSKRNKLVNVHYFCRGEGYDNKKLWEEVFAYIEATYDTSKIKRIYLNADGGSWIKSGYNGVMEVTHVLDEFHLTKYVLKLTGHMKDSRDDAKAEIYECIREKSKEDFFEIAERLKACTDSEKTIEKINDAANYIASNWTAAKYRLNKDSGVKSCSAEGHVYHVLSIRMSTPAMGWSRHGGSQMARFREYYYNGGDMLELAKYQKEELPMAAGAEEVILSAHTVIESHRGDWSRSMKEYGKYSEQMHHTISTQSRKRLQFQLRGKLNL